MVNRGKPSFGGAIPIQLRNDRGIFTEKMVHAHAGRDCAGRKLVAVKGINNKKEEDERK